MALGATDRQILAAIQDGLPLCRRPFDEVARGIGLDEAEVIERLRVMRETGVIKRLGLIVRHHELGYRANAMTVWDVPDEGVGEIGRRLKTLSFVTLCYRRPRQPPVWPYNLFCMIHGRDRATVEAQVEEASRAAGLEDRPRAILFSKRRFKQHGARFA